jgi:hypothetical protein
MPFICNFRPKGNGMSAAQYDEVMERLQANGAGNPVGRLFHICYGEPGTLYVTDVWDTLENFQAFGKILIPVLQTLGVDVEDPHVVQTHNMITGSRG